jgi:hypothetical protein
MSSHKKNKKVKEEEETPGIVIKGSSDSHMIDEEGEINWYYMVQ